MKLSLEWLKSYVDLPGIAPEEVAHNLTMATAEVEGVDRIERITRNVIVGEVIAVEPVETAKSEKTISFVTVDTGTGTVGTICGAPNVERGMKSAYAPPGTVIAEGFTVTEQTMYGHKSYGMLLSPKELGWGESHAGIFAFPASLTTGTELAGLVSPEDFIIDIDNKTVTHRPDLWGHYGFARELAAIYGRELKPLALADSTIWDHLPVFPLVIEDEENCPGYCCLDIDGLTRAFAPVRMQSYLLSTGLRPINLLVDLTNFIMCELGQPMHAFDGKRVRDIIVRPFGKRGIFRTLDSIERNMLPDDLMICDHDGSIALAGIMGGEESEIRDDTSRVLLESANFNPARIRRTSLRLNLRSDASMRFEKGQPPNNMAVSIRRFVQLLTDSGQKPEIRSRLTCVGDTGETKRTIVMPVDRLNRAIGMEIPPGKVTGILTSLGFDCDISNGTLTATVPRYRSARDISIPSDIVEEVARIYGYDNIVPAMPPVEMKAYHFNRSLAAQHKVRRFLSASRGFIEVHTYSWYDDNWLNRIGYRPAETLTLQNPASDGSTRIRLELIPNLLALVETNASHQDKFGIYELGNVHHPGPDGRKQYLNVAGIAYQTEKNGSLEDLFLSVKGTVEELFALLNADTPVFTVMADGRKPWEAAQSTMEVYHGKTPVGQIGYLTDRTFPVFEKGTRIVWFELNLDTFEGQQYPPVVYKDIPVYPGSWMDFSILAGTDVSFEQLDSIIRRFSHPILRQYRFLYRYGGKGLPEGQNSFTFRFWLGVPDRTLTGDDLTGFHESFIGFLTENGLSIR